MSITLENTEADTRHRILVVAERLFRQIGYQKTTVGDIAKDLRMSPANVYRFFESKKSIHQGVARRLMGEVEEAAQVVASRDGPASPRLRELLSTIHHMNAERYVGDAKLHEMVKLAMEENWDVCKAHVERLIGLIAKVIGDGVAAGEFDVPDVPLAAVCTCGAMEAFFHPQMISEAVNKPVGATLEQMIDFVLRALAPRGAPAAT